MKQAKAQQLSLDSTAIKNEYKAVLTRADDIGKSHLMSSYCMGIYFIALNRKTTFLRRNASVCLRTDCIITNYFIRYLGMRIATSMRRNFLEGRNGPRSLIGDAIRTTGCLTSLRVVRTMTSYSVTITITAGSAISVAPRMFWTGKVSMSDGLRDCWHDGYEAYKDTDARWKWFLLRFPIWTEIRFIELTRYNVFHARM